MLLTSPMQSHHRSNESLTNAAPTHEEFYRLSTFKDALEGLEGNVLARRGFFYNERTKEVECFSCGIRHRLRYDQYRAASSVDHSDTCSFDNGSDVRNVPIIVSSSYDVDTHFPNTSNRDYSQTHRTRRFQNESSIYACDNPVYDRMRHVDDRVTTFIGHWPPSKTQCSTREIADAGFFYIGPDDEVVCWYCGGGLERWNYRDDPWLEHAKFHPVCEYLLSRRGTDYVADIVDETPYVTRPTIRRRERSIPSSTQHVNGGVFWQGFPFNTSSFDLNTNTFSEPNWERRDFNVAGGRRRTVYRAPGISVTTTQRVPQPGSSNPSQLHLQDQVDRAMASSLVFEVVDMGFSNEEIRRTMLRRLEENQDLHGSASELIDDILSFRSGGSRLVNQQPMVWNNRNLTISTTSRSSLRDIDPTTESSIDPIPRETSTALIQSRHRNSPSPLQEERSSFTQETSARQGICCLCGDWPVKVVFMPCSHLVTCEICGMNQTHCPVCDNAIERKITVRTQ